MAEEKKPRNLGSAMFGLDEPKAQTKDETRKMTEPQKPRNPANALFGLDDVSIAPSGKPEPSGPAQQPAYPSVNFGPRPQTAEAPPSAPQPPPAETRAGQPPASQGPAGNAPQYIYVQGPPPPPAPLAPAPSHVGKGLWTLAIIALIISVVSLVLILNAQNRFSAVLTKQADQLSVLGHRADSSDDHYAQLSAKFQVEAERLGMTQAELTRARQLAVNIERQQKQAVTSLNAAIAEKASSAQVNTLQTQASAQFGALNGSLAGTQKDLKATQDALTGTKGELTGAIAKTHSELVALAHRTDRDYFEFHLSSRGSRQKIGGVRIQLIKTNTKYNLYTVDLFFDDKRTQRKNESIDEPVFFYMQGAPSALELVVNNLGKNAISGYISAPKGFIAGAANVLSARPTG
jgi:hypothetical protein